MNHGNFNLQTYESACYMRILRLDVGHKKQENVLDRNKERLKIQNTTNLCHDIYNDSKIN